MNHPCPQSELRSNSRRRSQLAVLFFSLFSLLKMRVVILVFACDNINDFLTDDGKLVPLVLELADADIRVGVGLLDQVANLLVEPLGRLLARLGSVVAVVEGGKLLEGNLHVGGREAVDIATVFGLLHRLLGKGYKKGKQIKTRTALVVSAERAKKNTKRNEPKGVNVVRNVAIQFGASQSSLRGSLFTRIRRNMPNKTNKYKEQNNGEHVRK